MATLKISNIWIHPIKSLGGIWVESAELDEHGIKHDRRMMLVDANGVFVTQRNHAHLALVKTAFATDGVVVTAPNQSPLHIRHSDSNGTAPEVAIWDSQMQAGYVSAAADQWFSVAVGQPVRLVRMTPDSHRLVSTDFSKNGATTGFTDGFPMLIIGEAALETLNSKLQVSIPMERFRPNVSFSGGEPHEEDFWKSFQIGNSQFWGVKQCSRCVMTTIDQRTGRQGKEPLHTLAGYRRFNNQVMFGQNVLTQSGGRIAIGDSITVLERHADLAYMVH